MKYSKFCDVKAQDAQTSKSDTCNSNWWEECEALRTVNHCLSECEYSMVYFTVIKTVEIFMFGI